MKLIELKNLTKEYDDFCVLKDVNFSLEQGEIVSIMGPSGTGKTTLLNILLSFDMGYEGEYIKNCNSISTVFQEDRLLPWMNIYENLKLINPKIKKDDLKAILDLMKLTDFASFPPLKLSGGMKERVAMARALCYDAELLIMDEPLKSTDKKLSNEILKYLKAELKRRNKSLLMVTHDAQNAISISDKIYILDNKPANFVDCLEVREDNKDELLQKLTKYETEPEEKPARKVPGHVLLARLGKKRLRPGGIKATTWLTDNIDFKAEPKILEVACNMGTTLIELVKKHDCKITGVDRSEDFLSQAKENVAAEGIADKVELILGDARDLPFEDNSFDVIINEAMLTMLSHKDKQKAVAEYYRVLKPGGKLLTHDIRVPVQDHDAILELRKTISIAATPLTIEEWGDLFKGTGFSEFAYDTDQMSLMSKEGMERDEGKENMNKIFEKAKSDPNFDQFIEMRDFFARNKDYLFYIAACSTK